MITFLFICLSFSSSVNNASQHKIKLDTLKWQIYLPVVISIIFTVISHTLIVLESISYDAKPDYHFDLGKQLKSLRDKGVLIIGSGSLIHNLQLAGEKFRANDMTPYGWEAEYDAWLKKQIETRNFKDLINYQQSHKLGKLASPTPDHFVPVLYSLGLADKNDEIEFFYDTPASIPAFSERSFIIKSI